MKAISSTSVVIALMTALFGGGCSTTQEVEVPGPPQVFAARSVPLIERKIAGQVFWTTQGRETIKASGVQILVYDASQLASARATILAYERTQYDVLSQTYLGLPSTVMRARLRIQAGVDSSWAQLGPPVATIVTDAEGRFEIQAKLPERLGIYCEADSKIFGENEPHRWAVTEDESQEPGRIILSNLNMLRR